MPKRMNESTKTICFAGTGIAMLLLAGLAYYLNQPARRTGFERVGQAFFEEFESSSQANSLEVVAIDPDSARMKEFRVEQEDGVWSIPPIGYPAEAADRLAKTSSSLLGLTRESLVGRLAAEHERFGVVDPRSEDNLDPEAAGKRITLKDENDEILFDLIIGKEAGEEAVTAAELGFNQTVSKANYYVRHPDEAQTYKVALDLELSTRFSDWIRPDLLDLEGAEVKRMDIDNFKFELVQDRNPLGAARLYKTQGDQMKFSRDTGFGPWTMDGLVESDFDLDSKKIDAAVSTLDSLRIVGVRKKASYKDQPILNPDFSLRQIPQEELAENTQQYISARNQFAVELSENGFNLTPVGQNTQELTILPNSGQMVVGRGDGVVYTLLFGNPISGDEDEIKFGKSDESEAASSGAGEEESGEKVDGSDAKQDDPANAGESGEAEPVKNRFLMIRVDFDETMLGEKPAAPQAPTEPEKPEGYVAADAAKPVGSSEEAAAGASEPEASNDDEKPADSDASDTTDETEAKPADRPEAFVAYDQALAAYQQLKTQYVMQQTKFETDSKQFAEKVAAGKKLVEDLNQRFGKWFYVISADNLNSLQMSKDDLVTVKEAPEANPPGGLPPGMPPVGMPPAGLPQRPNIQIDNELMQTPAESPQEASQDSAAEASEPSSKPPAATEPTPATESAGSEAKEAEKVEVEKPEKENVEKEKVENEVEKAEVEGG